MPRGPSPNVNAKRLAGGSSVEEGAEEESDFESDPEVEEAGHVLDWVALGLCVL